MKQTFKKICFFNVILNFKGGPLQKVNIPKDRDGKQKNFGFVTYKHLCSVPYALELFDGTCLFNRLLNLKNRNSNSDNSNQYFQQLQQQQQQQPFMQSNTFEMQLLNFQNQMQLGQQLLMGNQLAAFNMMPGSVSYSSQNNDFLQNPQISDHSRNRDRDRERDRSGRHNRHHPYQNRDRHDDRQNGRQESYNRDHKSYRDHRSSSHRSNRHDNRRKY